MSEQRDYSAQDSATMRKWEREIERGKAKAEASEETFRRTFADTLKQENAKKALARVAREAVDAGERGQVDPTVSKAHGAGGSMFDGDRSSIVHGLNGDLDSSITGEEPRPWEDR